MPGKLILFRIGPYIFGLDIMQVIEVLTYREPEQIPGMPEFMAGIVSFRNKIVPIMHFRRRLNHSEYDVDEDTRIIIFRTEGHVIGIIVDDASEVFHYGESKMLKKTDYIGSINNEYIDFFLRSEDDTSRVIIVLDFNKILTTEESIILNDFREKHSKVQ